MKFIEQIDATAPLAGCAAADRSDPLIVTSDGQPVAALVPIENADKETVVLTTDS